MALHLSIAGTEEDLMNHFQSAYRSCHWQVTEGVQAVNPRNMLVRKYYYDQPSGNAKMILILIFIIVIAFKQHRHSF